MKLKNSIFGILLIGAAALTVSCSENYLETSPTDVADQETVSKVMQDDPSQVQAYVTGALMNLYCGGDYWISHDDFGLPAVKLATDLMCEDIAYTNGWITREEVMETYEIVKKNQYGQYLKDVLDGKYVDKINKD